MSRRVFRGVQLKQGGVQLKLAPQVAPPVAPVQLHPCNQGGAMSRQLGGFGGARLNGSMRKMRRLWSFTNKFLKLIHIDISAPRCERQCERLIWRTPKPTMRRTMKMSFVKKR